VSELAVVAFEDQAGPAMRLAEALGAPFLRMALHRFPDGEVMPIAPAAPARVILYGSLNRPNERIVALLLAADAIRRRGVERLILAAPYLCYMRQDAVFAPGEPLSRDVIGRLIGSCFARLVTVDAHMHRTHRLSDAIGAPSDNLSAAEPLAQALMGPDKPLVVGPDSESEPWVRAIAGRVGGEAIVFRKRRAGDRTVTLEAPDLSAVRGRATLLVDDICSTGATLAAAVRILREAGAASIDIGVTHALFDEAAEARLEAAGARRIVSTDSVMHKSNRAPLAGVLAAALADEVDA
jgi:ribose-phosphate pyrophosphokinase